MLINERLRCEIHAYGDVNMLIFRLLQTFIDFLQVWFSVFRLGTKTEI